MPVPATNLKLQVNADLPMTKKNDSYKKFGISLTLCQCLHDTARRVTPACTVHISINGTAVHAAQILTKHAKKGAVL